MNKYFDEKASQVSYEGQLKAFNIRVVSRYEKAWEIIEMLNFCMLAAEKDIHTYVEEIFYDSKANVCSFEFSSELKESSTEAQLVHQCAAKTISQFEIFGYVDHGEPLKDIM